MLPPIVCSACQHKNPSDSTVCAQCGAILGASKASTPPVQAVAPRTEDQIRKRDSRINQTVLVGIICLLFGGISKPLETALHATGFVAILLMLIELATSLILIICHVQYCYLVGNKKGYPLMVLLGFVPCAGVILAAVWPTNPNLVGSVIVEDRDLIHASPDQATTVGGQVPYMAPAPVAPTAIKPSYQGVIIAIVAMALVCGVCGGIGLLSNNGSGVMVDGKELSKTELSTGVTESKAMFKDYTNINESTVTTSPLSTKLKTLTLRSKQEDIDEQKARSTFDENQALLDTARSQAKLVENRKKFLDSHTRTNAYLDSRTKSLQEIQGIFKAVDGVESPQMAQSIELMANVKAAWLKVQANRMAIIDFLEKTPHSVTKEGTPEFTTAAKAKEFSDLVDSYFASVKAVKALK